MELLKLVLRQYFSFSRGERHGIVFLCTLLLLIICINILIGIRDNTPQADPFATAETAGFLEMSPRGKESQNIRSLFKFDPNTISEKSLDSLDIPEFVKNNMLKYRIRGGFFDTPESLRKIYGMDDSLFALIRDFVYFDKSHRQIKAAHYPSSGRMAHETVFVNPNTATAKEFENLGFNKFQIQNILKYRQKGGVFTSPSGLLKIYGIDSEFYSGIQPGILISESFSSDSSFNHEVLGLIELNSADSILLNSLVGIGPVFAARIIRYRNLLGGFYDKQQLLEVYNFKPETYDHIKNKIWVDTVKIKRMSINFSDFGELVHHPYLSTGDVRKIVDCRNRSGPFKKSRDLLSKNVLDKEKFDKIRPYIKVN